MTITGVVVMNYGTPDGPDDVERYYTDIRRGRPPTPEQLADLHDRYEQIGGLSPLRAISAAQAEGLTAAFATIDQQRQADDPALGERRHLVEIGTKHGTQTVAAAVARLVERGADRIAGLVMAPHYSIGSIAQYHGAARSAAEAVGLAYAGVDSWATLDAYVAFLAGAVERARAGLPKRTFVVFTAHALPEATVADDPYVSELTSTAEAVAQRVGLADGTWSTGWQSAPRDPRGAPLPGWLGPDIADFVASLAADGRPDGVLVCPCGFVADHLEILYDLDILTRRVAESHGLAFARTASLNADPDVLTALAGRVADLRW